MNTKEFIEKYLQNCRYDEVLTKEAEKAAKENGLVVVFGASDDLYVKKSDVISEVYSAFEWYYTNYGYRNGVDILRDNLIESINALGKKSDDTND